MPIAAPAPRSAYATVPQRQPADTTRTSRTQRQPAPLQRAKAAADTEAPPAESCTCSVFALVGLILPLLVACVRWMGWPLPDKLLLQALCNGSGLLWWAEVANCTSLVLSLCRVALQCRHCRRRKAAEESLQSTLGMQEKKDTKVKANENKNSKKSNAHSASRGHRLLSLPQKAAGNGAVARS